MRNNIHTEALSKVTHETRAKLMVSDVMAHHDFQASAESPSASPHSSVEEASSMGSKGQADQVLPTQLDLERYTRMLNNVGEIMIHGVMVVVSDADLENLCVSDNSATLFGVEPGEMLGKCFLDFFEEDQRIQSAITMEDVSLANPVTVTIKSAGGAAKKPAKVNLILHRIEQGLLVDVESLPPTENSFAAHQRVRVGINKIHMTDNVHSMCQLVVEEVTSTTGYDRVMMYKFHEDMHGEVISECLSGDVLSSLLGVHYPATDVPIRVRDQFKANSVRIIVDSSASHSKLVFKDGLDLEASEINMSMSSLRRAHDCHLEYMRGMSVAASLCLAIVVKEHLWGLVVCHHHTPRFVSYQARMACEFLAQALSMRLSNLLDAENHAKHDKSLQLHAKLCDLMYQQGHNPGLRLFGLVCSEPNLMDLIQGVNGAACVHGTGKYSSVGVVPDQEHMSRLIEVIRKKTINLEPAEPYACISIEKIEPGFKGNSQTTGVLALRIDNRLLMWFRPEFVTTIRWGGDPSKWVVKEGEVLRPRKSFATFVDSVKGTCTPWLRWEVHAAHGLGLLVHDMLMASDSEDVRSNVLVRLNDERMQTKGEKEAVVQEMGQLMDNVNAGIVTMDPQLSIQHWNQSLMKLTGIHKDDVVGRPVANVLLVEERESVLKSLRAALGGDEVKNMRMTIVRPDGERIEFVVSASSHKLADGTVNGVVCVGQDLSEGQQNLSREAMESLDKNFKTVVTMHESMHGIDVEESLEAAGESSFVIYGGDKTKSLLGEGHCGKTHRMQSKIDEQIYAVKMINVKKAEKNNVPVTALKREVQMLLKLGHPSIVRYFTCYMYKQSKYFCIVMELLDGGTLAEMVLGHHKRKTKIEVDVSAVWVQQIAEGLAHIHSKKMLHRDLKPHNILLNKDHTEAKITDFGLACVVSSAAASSRAGTLNYASPEKAMAKEYNSKDDMWAFGCIVSELLLSQPLLQSRTQGGIPAFNQELVQGICDECLPISPVLGPLVAQLLEHDPDKRMSATEAIAVLSFKGGGTHQGDAEELCEEYICPICQELVLDAHSVCADEHVFCGSCLQQWLEAKNECPTCRTVGRPRRLRVINNAVEKLAIRVLSDAQRAERETRRNEEKEERSRVKEAAAAAELAAVSNSTGTIDLMVNLRGGGGGGGGGSAGGDFVSNWVYARSDSAQFGSGCTILCHLVSRVCIEVFHGNGWFRFRAGGSPQIRWCNSCGNLGESEFGAPQCVAMVEAGGGDVVPPHGLGRLDMSNYWDSEVQNSHLVLTNSDEEALCLKADGSFVWLSHPSMDKAVSVIGGIVETISREDALILIPNIVLPGSSPVAGA